VGGSDTVLPHETGSGSGLRVTLASLNCQLVGIVADSAHVVLSQSIVIL
jgi:hypothetical protein